MKFKKTWLQNLLWEDVDEGEIKVNDVIDTSRWSVIYNLVFEFRGKFYQTSYSVGATESQDESPFEYEPDEIEVTEVKQIEKTVIDYVKV